jgi:hypothetical protein
MSKVFLLFFILIISSKGTQAQHVDLSVLIKAYNSSSITRALQSLSTLKTFEGQIQFDSSKNDSLLIGIIGKDTIKGVRIKNKIQIEFKTYQQPVFLDIQRQANQKLYHSNDYARGSKSVIRHHHVYSNKLEMKKGDLWFILTECTTRNGSQSFYELTLKTYDEE